MKRYGGTPRILCAVLAACAVCIAGCTGEKESWQNGPLGEMLSPGPTLPGAEQEPGAEKPGEPGQQNPDSPTGSDQEPGRNPGEPGEPGEPGQQSPDSPTGTGQVPEQNPDEPSTGPLLSGTAAQLAEYYKELTLQHARAMLSGDFSLCGSFSAELAGAVSERDMRTAWKKAVQELGGPVSDTGEQTEDPEKAAIFAKASFPEPPSGGGSGSIEDFGGYVLASAQIAYEKKNLIVSITYGTSGAIEGIYLTTTLPETGPVKTESFTEYEVSVGSGEHLLDGLLTVPNGAERSPVVLLIHGSGQSDKNETVGPAGNAPFADIAHGLAERGIATLRYNKRYFQYPDLVTENVTIQDEVLEDAAGAIRFLSENGRVDGSRIYVLGHSLGGMLAPYLVRENPHTAGMISLAGSPRGLWEIVYDQNIAAMREAQLDESEQEVLMKLLQEDYEQVLALVDGVRRGEEIPGDVLSGALFGVCGNYWASLAEIDTAAIARELSLPMLILQGEADFQVYPERDFAAWQTLLEGKKNVSFRLFEGLNHLFMPSDGTRDVTEYGQEGHVSEEVIQVIADWIKAT